MAGVFQPAFVISNNGDFISLKLVESMNLITLEADELVNKLKGDATISIVTCSGAAYTISMKHQITAFSKHYNVPKDVEDVRAEVWARWTNLHS